jgi:hypothetical protein
MKLRGVTSLVDDALGDYGYFGEKTGVRSVWPKHVSGMHHEHSSRATSRRELVDAVKQRPATWCRHRGAFDKAVLHIDVEKGGASGVQR